MHKSQQRRFLSSSKREDYQLQIGMKVRLRRPKKTHPWRRGRKPYRGKGTIEGIREVNPSPIAPDGRIYLIRLSKLTVKEYTILELTHLE